MGDLGDPLSLVAAGSVPVLAGTSQESPGSYSARPYMLGTPQGFAGRHSWFQGLWVPPVRVVCRAPWVLGTSSESLFSKVPNHHLPHCQSLYD